MELTAQLLTAGNQNKRDWLLLSHVRGSLHKAEVPHAATNPLRLQRLSFCVNGSVKLRISLPLLLQFSSFNLSL